jgi:hypothetical protein
MKYLGLALLFLTACASPKAGSGGSTSLPGHGAISLQITPNPIVAHDVGGNTFDFPFDVVVRETGGHAVNIRDVSADVYALGGVPVASETYDAAKIRSLGFPTMIPANGELHYHLDPRKNVTDQRLFSGVTADVRVDGTDDSGAATSTHLVVSVVKG